jgi:hypothetical protein
MDDLFPPIDEALLKKLDEVYPEASPDPSHVRSRDLDGSGHQAGGAHAAGRLS